jgi:hypothetical protein
VWAAVGNTIVDGRIVLPLQVYRETTEQDEEDAWMKACEVHAVDPTEEVQKLAGKYIAQFPRGTRYAAGPFVLAGAQVRGFSVVTYEGRSFSGVPTRWWRRSMPGICSISRSSAARCPRRWACLACRSGRINRDPSPRLLEPGDDPTGSSVDHSPVVEANPRRASNATSVADPPVEADDLAVATIVVCYSIPQGGAAHPP